MTRRIAATLSSTEIDAPGPPMSVRTQPGLITATVMPRGRSENDRARIAMFFFFTKNYLKFSFAASLP